jgi:uncharacterized protein YjiK
MVDGGLRLQIMQKLFAALLLACLPSGLQDPSSLLAACHLDGPATAQWSLPGRLREISGLARLETGELLAHNDERARVTVLDEKTGAVLRSFDLQGAPRDDIEGIAVGDGILYLMNSSGRVYVTRVGQDGEKVPYTTVETGLGRLCELEGLAWDGGRKALILPCKRPRAADLAAKLILFVVPVTDAEPSRIEVPLAEVARRSGQREIEPTAVEVDPQTGHILVLSSGPRMVVELAGDGTLVGVTGLKKSRHPQPEGITILPGAILVSDEGTDGGPGTISVYACQR